MVYVPYGVGTAVGIEVRVRVGIGIGVTVTIFGVAVAVAVICGTVGRTNIVLVGAAEVLGAVAHATSKKVVTKRTIFFILFSFPFS